MHVDPAAVAFTVVPETAHAPETAEYDTAPEPEPPDDANVSPTPKVPERDVT
jgi:hypothetical protein